MDSLSNPAVIKSLCKRYGFSFSKSLGQNFIVDSAICPEIARLGIPDDAMGVLEIGTGFGVLTRELCKRAKKAVAVEIDAKLFPVLEETLCKEDNLSVIQGDILKIDLKALIEQEFAGMELVVCANLPYYITSPVIMRLLEERLPIRYITVMVQREAADRLCAKMGTRACGAVTAAVRYYSEPEILFPVARESFLPPPNVDSSVIRLSVFEETPFQTQSEPHLFSLIKAAFGQRRKTLVNPVSAAFSIPKAAVVQSLSEIGAKPTARAEELTLEQFVSLSNKLVTLM